MTNENPNNNKESSSVLMSIGIILILISIILPLHILGMISITSTNTLSGININVEQLNIKNILWAAFVIIWIIYWQYSKVDANRKMLVEQMNEKIKYVREEFFNKIACPNIKDCFDTEYCYITEKEDLPKSKNNFFRRDKKIEIYGVAYRYENYYAGSNHKVEDISKAEIKKIEKEGWRLKKNTPDSRNKPIFTKVFKYNPLKLKFDLLSVKIKFKITGTYLFKYTIAHCFAAIAFSVFIVDFFAFSFCNHISGF